MIGEEGRQDCRSADPHICGGEDAGTRLGECRGQEGIRRIPEQKEQNGPEQSVGGYRR